MDFWMAQRGAKGPGRAARLLAGSAVALLVALLVASSASAYSAASWGENLYRQLGNGSTNASSATPVAVSGLTGVTALAAGGRHSLALLSNGTVMAWGDDEAGQLGDGGSTLSSVPVAVSGLTGVKAIAAGENHSLALLNNGTVMAWGENEEGQLGNGKTTDSAVPVAVKGLTGVKAIAAGGNHSLALLTNGTVMAWGENEEGQLGNGKLTNASSPVAVKALSGVSAIAAGAHHSLALLTSGALMAWGSNGYGQLGHAEGSETEEEGFSSVPVTVLGVSGASAIAAGGSHSVALVKGAVMTWGADERGQLGNATTARSFQTPATVSGLTGVSAIAAGGQRTMALLSSGIVIDWGDNEWGALGTGSAGGFSDVPVAVSGLGQVSGISAGTLHSLTYGEPTPAVSALSPNTGSGAGGTSVTITGSNLAGASAVKFGTHAASSITVNSASSITAIAPAGVGTIDVTVTTPAGTSPAQALDRFTYLPPPIVKKLAPNTGPAGGGSSVTITGSGFLNVSAVHFGASSAASFIVNSPTSITAISPPGSPGASDVTVTTASGTSALVAADRFNYAPSVSAISPNRAPVTGHVEVTISGSGFALGASATIIKFATKRAGSVNCSSSTTCTAIVPAHEAGTIEVRVTVNKVTSPLAPSGDSFTYG
jgi:alpha-tubulin suppressor-like RCC1 family protein